MVMDACCDEVVWRRLVSRRRLLRAGAGGGLALATAAVPWAGVRSQDATPVASPAAGVRVPIEELEPIVNGSFVSPLAEVFGDVEIGRNSFVAGNTILYATEGRRVSIGDESNVQDNCYLLANRNDVALRNLVVRQG